MKNITALGILFWFSFGSSFLATGQSFIPTTDNLLPIYEGPIEWADLDNDNDLDLIYCGLTGLQMIFSRRFMKT